MPRAQQRQRLKQRKPVALQCIAQIRMECQPSSSRACLGVYTDLGFYSEVVGHAGVVTALESVSSIQARNEEVLLERLLHKVMHTHRPANAT